MSDCSSPASSRYSSYSAFSGAQTPETHLTSPSQSREGSPKASSTFEYTANTSALNDAAYYSSFFPDASYTSFNPIFTPEDPNFFDFASAPLIPSDYLPMDSTALFDDPSFDLDFFSFDPTTEVPLLQQPEPEPQQPVYSFWQAPPPPRSIDVPTNSGYPPPSAFYGPLPGTFSDPPKPNFHALEYEYEPWYAADGRRVEFSPAVASSYIAAVGM